MYGGSPPRPPWSFCSTTSTFTSANDPVLLIWLRLALGSLRLGVGHARRIRLLHGHGPPQVRSFAKEVRFGWETERALPQDHADGGGLLGSGSMAKLKRGEMSSVALTQKLNTNHRHYKAVRKWTSYFFKVNLNQYYLRTANLVLLSRYRFLTN